ncbi:MAG TPA: hypothetical protein VFE01_11800 [Terracidiphilus sp.]|nr:hypothetical protein [Terracidiphilus sp.]
MRAALALLLRGGERWSQQSAGTLQGGAPATLERLPGEVSELSQEVVVAADCGAMEPFAELPRDGWPSRLLQADHRVLDEAGHWLYLEWPADVAKLCSGV